MPQPGEPTGALAAALKRLRDETRATPTQIEKLTGVKRATIYNIENGRTLSPDPDTLSKIAYALARSSIGGTEPDARLYDRYFQTLMRAARYAVPPLEDRESPPDVSIQREIGQANDSASIDFASGSADQIEVTYWKLYDIYVQALTASLGLFVTKLEIDEAGLLATRPDLSDRLQQVAATNIGISATAGDLYEIARRSLKSLGIRQLGKGVDRENSIRLHQMAEALQRLANQANDVGSGDTAEPDRAPAVRDADQRPAP